MPEPFLGALLDTRPEVEKQKDVSIIETVAAAAGVPWQPKSENQWRKFPDQNQSSSGSCVAQTKKKLNGIKLKQKIGKYVEFSATPTYQRRSNKPSPGMVGIECFELERAHGATFEFLVPSQLMSDEQMDSAAIPAYADDVGRVFKDGGHVGFPSGDIETVASTINVTGKGVMVWFYFTSAEWSKLVPTVDVPNLDLAAPNTLRHSVAAVDFFLHNGEKALLIEDSAHFGGLTRRIITESMYRKRNWFARYSLNFQFDEASPVTPKPTYTFTKPLTFIPISGGGIADPILNESQKADVKALQDILKYEGRFPSNVDSTGYYGALTARGVYSYQIAHAVAPKPELDAIVPKGGRVGAKTIADLNARYGA